MSLFAASPVYCPSCGALYPAIISGSSGLASVAGIHLCCSEDCREALRQAYYRQIMGIAQDGKDPLVALRRKQEKAGEG